MIRAKGLVWSAGSVALLLALLWAQGAGAAEDLRAASERALLEEGGRAINAWRADDARRCADELLRRDADSCSGHGLAAQATFLEGRYDVCREQLAAYQKSGGKELDDVAEILQRLRSVHDSFQERETEHFRLRWSNPADAVLAEYAPDVLEKALAALGPRLRYGSPAQKIVVEFYPDIASFSAASTLSLEDIERTGAAGICKFNRIMLASPRLYVQGYRWCDSLAHELVHHIVVCKTGNRVPVWLHEGIAKRCETLWRGGGAAFPPLHATLLAEAREQNCFIAFERMHPSLAKLDSQQEAALAFAEAASFVRFLEEKKGPDAVGDLLDRVAAGSSVDGALGELAGLPFKPLCEKWTEWVRAQKFERIPGVRVLPVRLSRSEDNAERSSDLSGSVPAEAYRYARLGDMLRDEMRVAAAAIEYRKATAQTEGVSPELYVRLAQMQIQSDAPDQAQRTLAVVEKYYDDYLPLYLAQAEARSRRGETEAAAAAMETAIQINPFDPRPHEELERLYGKAGRADDRAREERVLKLIHEWLGWR